MIFPAPYRTRQGFTLVEVALALAVASMAIMAVVGLIPMLLNSERENTVKNLFPAMCSQVMGKLRTDPYPLTLPSGITSLYFTDQGAPAANAQEAVFECEIFHKALTAEAARPGGAQPPDPGNHCHMVQMKFRWPAGAVGGKVRTFQATLAND